MSRARVVAALAVLIASATSSVPAPAHAQSAEPLRIQEAVARGLAHFRGLAAKKNEIGAAKAQATAARDAYLPDVTAAVQHSYGTVNGAFGPQTPIGWQNVSSSGPSASEQSWNAGFGANYLLAASWEFFTFGRVDSRIDLADASLRRARADLEQERFVHGVKVAGAYLDLLVSQQLTRVAESNLERASSVRDNVGARSRSGLVPEVDLSMADAEVSRARLSVVDARDREQRNATQLAIFLDAPNAQFALDTRFLSQEPSRFDTELATADNPQLKFQQARIDEAEMAARATKRSILPGINLVGAYQMRGTGFDYDYSPVNGNFTRSYLDGIAPSRSNYVVGLTLSWNLMSPLKNRGPAEAREQTTSALQNEEALVRSQLHNQRKLADARIENMREFVREVPRQYDAAQAAYKQKNVLYENGLATLVEVQQTLYALNRAEADRSVAYVGLWQALLQKAAAAGDFELFTSQARLP